MTRTLFLWVTRSAPFNLLTAKHLRAAGHNPLAKPVIETRPLAAAPIRGDATALVFTSPNGVRHHRFDPQCRKLPVFAVGERTASLALEKGYVRVYSAAGDRRDLARLIRARLEPSTNCIVHLSAEMPAGDLTGELGRCGFRAERVAVYETVVVGAENLRPALAALPWIDGILVHSPRAAECVARFLAEMGRPWKGSAYCISEAAAEPLRMIGVKVEVAPRPNDAALRSLIGGRDASEDCPADDRSENMRSDQTVEEPSGATVLAFPRRPVRPLWDPNEPTPPSAA